MLRHEYCPLISAKCALKEANSTLFAHQSPMCYRKSTVVFNYRKSGANIHN